jgi:hypothetical protein
MFSKSCYLKDLPHQKESQIRSMVQIYTNHSEQKQAENLGLWTISPHITF